MSPSRTILALAAGLAILRAATAHEGERHGTDANSDANFGRPAEVSRAARTIRIEARDSLEFSPSEITLRAGEVVRFDVVNVGKHVHELVLGTMKELDEHNEVMKVHPHMQHEDPNMVQLEPGKSGTLVWEFTRPGEFFYVCLVEDHFDMGMIGKIHVLAAISNK